MIKEKDMKYRRIRSSGEFDYISVLDGSTGNLTTNAVWPDGFTLHNSTLNIFEVGWESLEQFLTGRKGFELIEN